MSDDQEFILNKVYYSVNSSTKIFSIQKYNKNELPNTINIKGDGNINISTFEKNEESILDNISLSLVDSVTNNIIQTKETVNGKVNFENLNLDNKFNIIAVDKENKYNGKYFEDIKPDYNADDLIIIKIYSYYTNSNYRAYYRFKGDGTDITYYILENIDYLTVEKIDDGFIVYNTSPVNIKKISYNISFNKFVNGKNYEKIIKELHYKK